MPYTALPYTQNGVTKVANGEVFMNNTSKDNPVGMSSVSLILSDLKYTTKSFGRIARELNTSIEFVSAVNNGTLSKLEMEIYPIRKMNKQIIEQIKQIHYALQYELDKSFSDIAREYSTTIQYVNNVNEGNVKRLDGKKYPLRTTQSVILPDFNNVIELLENSSKSLKDIARFFNVSVSYVNQLNLGEIHHQSHRFYPIRKNDVVQEKRTLTPKERDEIENLLEKTTMSIREIARRYNIPFQMITNLNNGKIVMYRKNRMYPIRDLRKYKTTRID